MEQHSWETPNLEVLCLLPAYAQFIPVMPTEFPETYHIPLTYAMKGVPWAAQYNTGLLIN